MWQREAAERPEFETKASMVAPGGELIMETAVANIDFLKYTVLSQRVVMNVQGFPVGHVGQCHIVLKTRPKGEKDFAEVARFPIKVNQEEMVPVKAG